MQAVCEKQSCSAADVKSFSKKYLFYKRGFKTFSQHCRLQPYCSGRSNEYRTFDGTCNNLGSTLYGSVGRPLERFLPAAYSDYISDPRKYGKNGDLLLPARHISEKVMLDIQILNDKMTTMMMYFGELLVHDFAKTEIIKLEGKNVPCCSHIPYDGCISMYVSPRDTFYSQFNVGCLNLTRSKATVNGDCKFGKREQENAITSFIDASFLYGSSEDQSTILRLNANSEQLKSSHGSLLPDSGPDGCYIHYNRCPFIAGDSRVNDNAGVAILHTVFLRAHNNIAKEIKSLKPSWNPTKIFQETSLSTGALAPTEVAKGLMNAYDIGELACRKIIGAMVQSITYREYVPLVVGTAAMSKYDLTVGNVPDSTIYNAKINPAIRNSFTTAAFRFRHATIPSYTEMYFNDGTTISTGMTKQRARATSVFMSSSVTKQWDNFRAVAAPFGSDLGAINIQRGRDHGLPPWNEFREFCGFSKYNSFEEIPDIDTLTLVNLKLSYKHVDDIDLFVGGLLERPVAGGATGETFTCLNAKQFELLKNGDRYFYTNGATGRNMKGFGYSAAQIKELNKASLARLFCDFTGIREIQPKVLEKADSCS
ncbi:Chorion peroxidase [Nymphon striatum]|nr:Chorion peroxidase [Nymphon striatum]